LICRTNFTRLTADFYAVCLSAACNAGITGFVANFVFADLTFEAAALTACIVIVAALVSVAAELCICAAFCTAFGQAVVDTDIERLTCVIDADKTAFTQNAVAHDAREACVNEAVFGF
jgi:hypothetical protein